MDSFENIDKTIDGLFKQKIADFESEDPELNKKLYQISRMYPIDIMEQDAKFFAPIERNLKKPDFSEEDIIRLGEELITEVKNEFNWDLSNDADAEIRIDQYEFFFGGGTQPHKENRFVVTTPSLYGGLIAYLHETIHMVEDYHPNLCNLFQTDRRKALEWQEGRAYCGTYFFLDKICSKGDFKNTLLDIGALSYLTLLPHDILLSGNAYMGTRPVFSGMVRNGVYETLQLMHQMEEDNVIDSLLLL